MKQPELLVFKIVCLTALLALVFLTSCTNTRFKANCVISKEDTESVLLDKVKECTNNPNIGVIHTF